MRAILLALLPSCAAAALAAQEIPRSTGTWDQDRLGNHRAIVEAPRDADAVVARIPWRRRDQQPELKRVIVTDAAGQRVMNVLVASITRESGVIVFQPAAGSGEYLVYYMPYQGSVLSNYPRITYVPADSTAAPAWLARNGLAGPDRAAALARLPAATVVEIQAADSIHRMDPMEVIATAEETGSITAAHPGASMLLFAEDRTRPIRMTTDLPQRWTTPGAGAVVSGDAQRGEFYAFQVGVVALAALDSVTVRFGDLRMGDNVIPAGAFSSFNTGGVDWQGRAFRRRVQVPAGRVQSLWCGVMIPEGAAPGAYEGAVTVSAAGAAPVSLSVRLTVLPEIIPRHGDNEPWRLSRLRWLDSRARLDTTLVAPYTAVTVRGNSMGVLGRSVTLAPTGLPAQVTSAFTAEMTAIGTKDRPLLAAPVAFVARDSEGRELPFRGSGVRVTRSLPGAALWAAESQAGPLHMQVKGQLDFDGNIEYTIAVTSTAPIGLQDLRLELPYQRDAARYFMGMNRKGGAAPASYDWKWDVKRNQDAAWIGDVNVGMQFTLKDDHYVRPLNTNFYQLRPLVMPTSWSNEGQGGCRFRAEDAAYRATCFSGGRRVTPGDTLWFNLRLLITPFHPIDTRTHFTTRYYHRYEPVDTIRAAGANLVNVHHATPVNPYINYPFLRPAAMRAYADSIHAAGDRMKIYYTVRELTNRAPEFWTLRSLGDEVLASGPGGGHSWLQEHVGSDYITGWVVPELHDVALVTSGISRWHNFYVEGLQWLVDSVGIDGLYLDDVAFDRITMQRIRRVLMGTSPGERIDLHSANQYNPSDGFASSANLYLEHFPYIDRLWFGEYFDYDSPPDYWLVEMSGIPFGLMSEMLQDGGNPWRGMVFGMTNRLPWAGDPRAIWKVWDDFGIADSRMIGWWVADRPVSTGRADVLATSYQREGRTLVSLASWAPDTVDVTLDINWARLGLDSARATLQAPAVDSFQVATTWRPGQPIRVAPGKGWLIVLQ